MDTAFHMAKRDKKKESNLMMVLMDITKAYDRVDRDILWDKMEHYGYSEKTLDFLKASYKDARGTIRFQNMESSEKYLRIGLKQGCVMSPILFAIFLADLTERLIGMGAGAKIGDIRIPAAMYADDIMAIVPEYQLRGTLVEIGEFAHKNKIEFSGAKSHVIPLHRKPNPDNEWYLGYIYGDDNEQQKIILKEQPEGKYLGISVSWNKNHYKTHWKNAVIKAKRQIWPISRLLKGLGRANQVAHKLMHIYSLPRFTYGLELAQTHKPSLDQLDIAQRRVARIALGAPNWTKNSILMGELGLWPMKYFVMQKEMLLAAYFESLPPESWAKIAYEHQKAWFEEDKVKLGEDEVQEEEEEEEVEAEDEEEEEELEEPKDKGKKTSKKASKKGWKKCTPKYWYHQVRQHLEELSLQPEDLIDSKVTKAAIWNKVVRLYNDGKRPPGGSKKDYLQYSREKVYPVVEDDVYKWDDTYFTWQMKTGMMAEKYDERFDWLKRGLMSTQVWDEHIKTKMCKLCKEHDSLEHALWECRVLKEQRVKGRITFIDQEYIVQMKQIMPFVDDFDNMSEFEEFLAGNWLLNREQSSECRKQVGRWIRQTLEVRKELIGILTRAEEQNADDLDPESTDTPPPAPNTPPTAVAP